MFPEPGSGSLAFVLLPSLSINKLLQTAAKMVCEFSANCIPSSSSVTQTVSVGGAEQKEGSISCTTFNILAPIYKRLDQQEQVCISTTEISLLFSLYKLLWISLFLLGVEQNQCLRESDFRAFWMGRNRAILDWLLYESSSNIICLQVTPAPCCSSLPDSAYETGMPCSTLLI